MGNVSNSVNLGRIHAVPIRGTSSLALLVALFAAMTAWGLHTVEPGYSAITYAGAALCCAVFFVWTVFVHEVAHVVAARMFRATVNGVTLSFVGGVTAISGQPRSPWQGVVVAAAGPAASALCGVGCFGAAFGVAALGLPTLVAVSLAWVGIMCLLLAAANLIPAAPLDGGHILHAAVWARTGNRVGASAITGFAGQVVAAGFLAWSGYLVVQGSWLSAASLAIFAFPVWRGATATRKAAQQRQRLAGAQVAEVMHRRFAVVDQERTAADAAAELGNAKGYAAVVDSAGRPVAVLATDAIRRASVRRPTHRIRRLRRWRSELVTATADEPLADVLERSHAHAVPVAVVAGKHIVGIIDPQDVEQRLESAPATATLVDVAATDTWPGRAAGFAR